MTIEILKVVIIPIAAGCLVHGVCKKSFDEHKVLLDKILSLISMSGICFTILALTAPSRATFASAGALIILGG